ncbi:hypothetical protein HZB96_01460 [Candidatus Gottesmanbacteria bacterium]|nr:hypothetical protein [Candidatus Gottesmanbacteria bacterium]
MKRSIIKLAIYLILSAKTPPRWPSSARTPRMVEEFSMMIFLIIILFFVFPTSIFAASITLNDGTPTTISDFNQEYQVNVSLSINADDGTVYYLRGSFYQSGTNNYCGYTWNGSSWFNGPYSSNEGWKNLLQVTISSSSASAILKAKLDSNDNACKDSGNYNLKVQRFTQGGSGTFDPQNEQSLTVNIPTPTPTVTPSPTPLSPTNTPSPSSTPQPQSSPTTRPSFMIRQRITWGQTLN